MYICSVESKYKSLCYPTAKLQIFIAWQITSANIVPICFQNCCPTTDLSNSKRKCSLGWFFGFKLHLIINEKGEVLNFMFTPEDVDNREPLKMENFVEVIYGKLET